MQIIDVQAAHLKNSEQESFFKKNGFIHIKGFLDQDVIDNLLSIYHKLHVHIDDKNQWNSLYDIGYKEGKRVSDLIRHKIADAFKKHFPNFDLPIATFMSKNPNPGSTCELHRDFSTFDESQVQYRNFWIPLIDINQQNGALYVIPSSHHIFTDIRSMFAEWPYEHLKDFLLNHKTIIYPDAGDLILYADKTLHGSLENKTNTTRPVLHGGVLPPQTSLFYYFQSKDTVKKYKVNLDFYLKNEFTNIENLKKYALEEEFKFSPKKISTDTLEAFFENHK